MKHSILKRTLALLLSLTLLVGLLAACGGGSGSSQGASTAGSTGAGSTSKTESTAPADDDEGGGETEASSGERISFTMAGINTLPDEDYTSDDFYQFMSDKFNVDVEVWANEASSANEKFNLAVNAGTLPDVITWYSYQREDIVNYADQGLLTPLPDGWETRWPNVAHLIGVSGYQDALTVDGQVYAIPHSVYGNFLEMDSIPTNFAFYYQKALAKEVGMDSFGDDYTVTLSELKEYLEKVGEAGLVEKPVLGGTYYADIEMLSYVTKLRTETAYKTDSDGWVFGPEYNLDTYVQNTQTLRDWYQEGLIDPDFYVKDTSEYRTMFYTGDMAALADGTSPDFLGGPTGLWAEWEAAGEGRNGKEDIGMAYVTADDGTYSASQVGNYWTMVVFGADVDPDVQARILDIIDWLSSKEGQSALQLGIPEVDWTYDADGKIEVINKYGTDVDYKAVGLFRTFGFCDDDFAFSGTNPALDPEAVTQVADLYDVKRDATVFYPLNLDYIFFSSDNKANLGTMDMGVKMTELVTSTDDIRTSLQEYIDGFRVSWEPMMEELKELYP